MEKVFECFDAGKNQITHKIYFNMEEYCKQKSLELKALKVKCKHIKDIKYIEKDIKYIDNDGARRSSYCTSGTSGVILVSLKIVIQNNLQPFRIYLILSFLRFPIFLFYYFIL